MKKQKIKGIHRKRLLKLIRHLERGKLHHKVFDFSTWDEGPKINGCRTNGCAVGECPGLFPRQWNFRPTRVADMNVPALIDMRIPMWDDITIVSAAKFFGVTYLVAHTMFTPEGSNLPYRAKRKTVAKHLRKFL